MQHVSMQIVVRHCAWPVTRSADRLVASLLTPSAVSAGGVKGQQGKAAGLVEGLGKLATENRDERA